MITKKRIYLFCIIALLMSLSGCGDKNNTAAESGRAQVTIAFWSDQLTKQYSTYLQEKFPEVDFTFYVATNSTDFYRFKDKHEDLPDILTVRRFALRDVADWKDSLLDLSDTELVNTFPQSYLYSYTYSDGTVNWLPACAEVDGIIVNRKLLEENGVPVPTNYQDFVDACGILAEQGIRPFLSNFSADYTCMEILQGLSIEQLNSQAGREWRQQYESGQTDQLSQEVWLPVFERLEEFISYTGITSADIEKAHTDILSAFQNNQLAMMRGTGNEEAIQGSVDGECLLVPYLGEKAEDGWYLTYPAFQVAAKETDDPVRRQLILDILTAMLEQEGLEHIASGMNMIPYNKGVKLDLSPELAHMQPYIDNNRLYIRLASSDMFSVSQTIVQGMIAGEYPDAQAALEAFNRAMGQSKENAPIAAHIDIGYSYAFNPETGSKAASAVLNSLREELGTQLLIAPAAYVAGNVAAGDYTQAELGFLTMGETPVIALCEMTGKQLYQYVEYVLTTPGLRGTVSNDSTLYVSSGFEMSVKRTDAGYMLEGLTVDGQELDREAVYTVAVLGKGSTMIQNTLDSIGITEYTESETPYKQLLVNRLTDGRPLAEPTNYISLR